MSTTINMLNDILANERACVNALRRLSFQRADPREREVIEHLHGAFSEICEELENIVLASGGIPDDLVDAYLPSEMPPAPAGGLIKIIKLSQQSIVAQLDSAIGEPALHEYLEPLKAFRQFHIESSRWFAQLFGEEKTSA